MRLLPLRDLCLVNRQHAIAVQLKALLEAREACASMSWLSRSLRSASFMSVYGQVKGFGVTPVAATGTRPRDATGAG